MTEHTPSLGLTALREAYRSGVTTPRQLLAEIRQRAAAFEDRNIWIHQLSEAELEPYLARLDGIEPDDLPLYGVPFAIKDNIDLAGIDTTAGCEAYRYRPKRTAFVVEQLIAAGAIPVGKTNLDQFATGLVGVRSPAPWGPCANSVDPVYVSGGSSSGSAVSVALGLVSFSLGTDTAGSGRVPAAFNNLVGLKPTKGRLSLRGVVPACQTQDCVSIFARSNAEAALILKLAGVADADDPWQREQPAGTPAWAPAFRFGVPKPEQRFFDGDSGATALFDAAIAHLKALGGEAVEVDLQPHLDAARLLYDGPWVAERYHVVKDLIEKRPETLLPVIQQVIGRASAFDAESTFAAIYQLQELKRQADQCWQAIDLILTPTAPTIYTRAAVEADPITLNSRLGTYTNFMNLLDYSALAIPAGWLPNGLPWGVTLFAPAFCDEALLALGDRLHRRTVDSVGALDEPLPLPAILPNAGTIDVLVCGAHLSGLPLNHQLTERGGVLIEATTTSPHYRMYALAGGPPYRPGMIRDTAEGQALPVEIWRVPADRFGSFVAGIPAPLGIGKVEVADGRWVCGFICEPCGLEGAEEITQLGGWRAFMAGR